MVLAAEGRVRVGVGVRVSVGVGVRVSVGVGVRARVRARVRASCDTRRPIGASACRRARACSRDQNDRVDRALRRRRWSLDERENQRRDDRAEDAADRAVRHAAAPKHEWSVAEQGLATDRARGV